ncbi:MAG: hypothetical protein BWK78_04665 [Thiotrichaceae bacterium IS1]|nr:MAG: hypothetical protein BWK78_04665 [Thiotrichaceae bacterium IS1]
MSMVIRWLGVLVWVVWAAVTVAGPKEDADRLDQEAIKYSQQGQFELAVQMWEEARSKLVPDSSPRKYMDISVDLAAAYQSLGRLPRALEVLQSAKSVVEKSNDSLGLANVLSQLSDVYLAMGSLEYQDCKGFTSQTRQAALRENQQRSEKYLYLAKGFADKINHPLLQASILNQQGNMLMVQKDYEKALEKYEGATGLAEQDKLLKAKILMNIAQARVNIAITKAEVKQGEKHNQAQSAIQEATIGVNELSDSYSHDKSFALIGLSRFWRDLHQSSKGEKIQSCSSSAAFEKELNEQDKKRNKQDKERFGVLMQAMDVNKVQENRRTLSYAKGYLAELYLEKGCYSEAKELTEQAIFYAGTYPQPMTESAMKLWGYPELLFQWEWQKGRILKALRQSRETVIATYEQAEKYLKAINYRSWSPSLREGEKDFYVEFANLLLKQAVVASKINSNEGQSLLEKTVKRVEQFKAAELRNYFQDDCVSESFSGNETTEDPLSKYKVAVFYPLLFEDENKVELLLRSSNGVHLLPSPTITVKDLREIVNEFRIELERTKEVFIDAPKGQRNQYLEAHLQKMLTTYAQPLHKQLIDPVVEKLKEQKLEIKTLVIVPDGFLRTLPFAALHDGGKFLIEEEFALAITPAFDLTYIQPMPKNKVVALLNGLSTGVGDFPALGERVKEELNKVSETLLGKEQLVKEQPVTAERVDRLEDADFTISQLRQKLEGSYSILHFTTHGHFDENPNNIYLLTHDSVANRDDNLKINMLKEFVSLTEPLELLTLSACQSALGDKASLGLAGVAIKVGARSALATLWSVDAEATLNLIVDFYENLANGKSKAQALTEAQRKLSKNQGIPRYKNPYYWAAFILIGNWLGYE